MNIQGKKNIVYIGGFDLPDKNAASQRVISNAKLFRELGYDVLLYGLSRSIAKATTFYHEDFYCCNLPYPKSIKKWFDYLTSIHDYIPFIEEQHPCIVIAYNHPSIALQKLADYCKSNGIKILSDCTEWYVPLGNFFFRKIKGWDVNKRMYDVHCKLDGVLSISRYLYDFYQRQNVNTLLLPPLVDLQEPKWKQKENDDLEISIRLIYAGELGKGNKDRVDMVIDALENISNHSRTINFVLDILGITKEQYSNLFPNKESVPSFVIFHGRKSHKEVIQMLLRSDFQIFLRENHLANMAGFPTKFVESISSKTIVLTNPSSNLGDYMEEGINSFSLNIDTFEDLVESLSHPLRLSKQEIRERRKKMDNTIFDYRNYTSAVENFLSSL